MHKLLEIFKCEQMKPSKLPDAEHRGIQAGSCFVKTSQGFLRSFSEEELHSCDINLRNKAAEYKSRMKKRVGLLQFNTKGISLVEVLVSAFLIALVFTSLTKIYYYSEYQINIARHKIMAINLIQANFENLLSTGYLGVNTGDYPVTVNITIDPGDTDATSDDITGTMTTQLVNFNTDEGYKFIATATWNEPYGVPNRTLTEVAELLITDYE